MRKTGLITVLLIIALLVLAGCGDQDRETSQTISTPQDDIHGSVTSSEEEQKIGELTEETVTTDQGGTEGSGDAEQGTDLEESEEVTEQPAIPQYVNGPYLGKLVEKIDLDRPVMVMIENSPAARPQTGLDQASIVYEYLVEGGITRFLALYYESLPTQVGPVRSTRPYFIQTALEYDAVLFHVGGSPEAFHLLAEAEVDHIDQISEGDYFSRSNKRRAPHNVYTGKGKLSSFLRNQNSGIGEEGESRFPYQIIGLVNQATARQADDIKIRYWGGYTVGYKYDETKGKYLRFIDGLPHLLEGGKKIYADNIFVQYVDTNVKDDEGRLEMQTTGTGKALLFKDGFIFEGKWSKEVEGKTYFLDDRGNEMQINPGQTWIQVVPLSVKVEF